MTDETDIPIGAIENGREFMRRLETFYDFECEGGPFRNCEDWDGLKRCFEALVDHIGEPS